MSLRDTMVGKQIFKLTKTTSFLLGAALIFASPGVYAVGDVVISEIMPNPVVISDSDGEWIELQNQTGSDIDIDGWTLDDGGSDYTFPANTTIPANGFLVICSDALLANNNCDLEWTGMSLAQAGDTITLVDDSGVVDTFVYDASDVVEGASLQKQDSGISTNEAANYGSGNTGTPGLPNNASLPVKNIDTAEEFNTIQEAIDDGNTNHGDTIYVKQGNTFNENLNIYKELTIKSDNKWGTTIVTQGAYRGIDIAANNVKLEGFKIILPDEANQGTAWHLKISGQSNVTLRDVVLYGPGKNSGYSGPNSGITGIDINSSQNIVLDRVTVEKYNKNGIAVTAKQNSGSVESGNIKFKDIIARNNGQSDGWAGLVFYTTSSVGQTAGINGVEFEGQNLIAWNPMGLFIDGSGGNVTGNSPLNVGNTSFNSNKYGLINAQAADIIALDSSFDGKNGINANQATRDYIENQIWHDCQDSPYLTGTCSGAALTYDFSTDYPPQAGSVNYTQDITPPLMSNINMYVNGVDTDIAKPGDNIKIVADVTDPNNVEKVQIWVRDYPYTGRQISSGLMSNSAGDKYEFTFTLPSQYSNGDAINQAFEGNYYNFRPYDDLGNNYIGSRKNFTVDATAPTNIGNITILQNSTILGCSAFVNDRSITVDWDDSSDANFSHYVYQADDGAGPIDFTTKVDTSDRSGKIRDLDGTYQYRVKAVDMAGNESDWSSWCAVTLDRAAPSIVFAGLTTTETQPKISGTTDSDVESLAVTIDGISYTATVLSGTWALPSVGPLAVGSYDVLVEATDSASNQNTETFSGANGITIEPVSQTVNLQDNQPTSTSGPVLLSDDPAGQTSNSPNQSTSQTDQNLSGGTVVQGESTDASQSSSQSDQSESSTEVGGITNTNTFAAQQTQDSSFNWWWLLAVLAAVIIGYGIYRFSTEDTN